MKMQKSAAKWVFVSPDEPAAMVGKKPKHF